jgi:putative lipoprotein
LNRISVALISGILTIVIALLSVPALLCAQTAADKPTAASVKGTALYRERIAMLPGATFEATLLDVSKMDAPAEVVATARIENLGNPPYSFSLEYDPARIVENHSYTVRATIKREGKPIFTSTESYPVITRGHPQEVNIILHSVAPESTSQSELKGRALRMSPQYLVEHGGWTLIRLGDEAIPTGPHDPEPNIEFNPKEHRVGGSGGCNRLMGNYELDGESLRFSKMATTMMACEKGMDLEKNFLAALDEVRTWKLGILYLDLFAENGELLARFQARVKK